MKTVVKALLLACAVSAQASTLTINVSDTQNRFWDAGNAPYGQKDLQLYVTNDGLSTQKFVWTPVGSNWTVCSGKICLSDTGNGALTMGTSADLFSSTPQTSTTFIIRDINTGRYVTQAANPANGAFVEMGTTPYVWKLTVVSTTAPAVTIMPFGDSITQGWSTTTTFIEGGYRCALAAALPSYSFIGNGVPDDGDPNNTNCPAAHWEGHEGYQIAQLQENYLNDVGTLKPNIILLMAGTNDVVHGNVSDIQTNLTSLINGLLAKDPGVRIIMSTIPPARPIWSFADQIPYANQQIRAVAAAFKFTLIDFYTPMTANIDANTATEGVHPSPAGYSIFENLWYQAITK